MQLSDWGNEERIDIREWLSLDNKQVPTKKGLSLPLQRWKSLCLFFEDIECALNNKSSWKTHLGGNVIAQVSPKFPGRVDIRQYFLPESAQEIIPTKKGVNISTEQFQHLVSAKTGLEQKFPWIKDIKPCFLQEDHTRLGVLKCSECTPNPEKYSAPWKQPNSNGNGLE